MVLIVTATTGTRCKRSWIQPSPTGMGRTGWQGRMKPGGRRRSRARGERINIARPIRRRAQAALPSRCCATNEPATQPTKPPKSAGVSDWKKYTPASHTDDQTPPRARRTSRQRAHVSSGTYGALSPRRQPSSPFRASSVLFFGGDLSLSWRIGRDRPPVRRV